MRLSLLSLLICASLLPGIGAEAPALAAKAALSAKALPKISRVGLDPDEEKLSSQIAKRLERVQEFEFIREEAQKLGVRAWLFGGTAAGYAHYVKWDLEREGGDSRYQPDRFDYDYTNIYRSTQDLDIVIDGTPEQARALQEILVQKYPHMQGSKTAWEVRLLTKDMGDKQALLNNPDFLNQHTDSNSTGMIEITKPPKAERVVRDLRDWKNPEPAFLQDIRDGALHYYFSPLHERTTYFKEGRNPPIVSVIRYLTKAFQYELKIRSEDRKQIEKIIRAFKPEQARENDYVAKWIEKNGKKLVQNAVNIEYATNMLDELGLRKKLAAIRSDGGRKDTLAWWMEKEPLRSKPVGQGRGATARELGLDTLAHETNSFPAYESITRAHTGDSNVLISRDGVEGEAALHGDGFYTRPGKKGARGTGLTIRFKLRPEAREGKDADFSLTPEGNVIVHNKSAIEVIPESLDFSLLQYMQFLKDGTGFDESDKALLEKLRRRVGTKALAASKKDQETVIQLGIEEARLAKPSIPMLQEWAGLPFVEGAREQVLRSLLRDPKNEEAIAASVFVMPEPQDPALRRRLEVARIYSQSMLSSKTPQDHERNHKSMISTLDELLGMLSAPVRADALRAVEAYCESLPIESAIELSYYQRHPRGESATSARLWERFDQAVKDSPGRPGSTRLANVWIRSPSSVDRPDLLRIAIGNTEIERNPPVSLILASHWAKAPIYAEVLKPFFESPTIRRDHIDYLASPAAEANPKLRDALVEHMIRILKNPEPKTYNFSFLGRLPPEKVPDSLKSALFDRMESDSLLVKGFFDNFNLGTWSGEEPRFARWLKKLAGNGGNGLNPDAVAVVLSKEKLMDKIERSDVLFRNAIRRAMKNGDRPLPIFTAISSRISHGKPPSLSVLRQFLEARWNPPLSEQELGPFLQWAVTLPYYRDPKVVELIPSFLRVLDGIPRSGTLHERVDALKYILNAENYKKDPRSRLWKKALEQRAGTRFKWLEAQQSCSGKFANLSTKKSRR